MDISSKVYMAKGEILTRVRPRQTNNSQLICAMRWQHAQHIRASPHSASTKTHRRQPPDGCSRSFAGPAIEDPMTLQLRFSLLGIDIPSLGDGRQKIGNIL